MAVLLNTPNARSIKKQSSRFGVEDLDGPAQTPDLKNIKLGMKWN